MCICIHCHYVDRCLTYHAVEAQHQQPHLTDTPDFEPVQPTIHANVYPPKVTMTVAGTSQDQFAFEFDVVGCESFVEERDKWARLRPGELIPT